MPVFENDMIMYIKNKKQKTKPHQKATSANKCVYQGLTTQGQ